MLSNKLRTMKKGYCHILHCYRVIIFPISQMYNLLLSLLYLFVINSVVANITSPDFEITCKDFRKLSAGLILYYTQSLADNKTQVIIYLSTIYTQTPVIINLKSTSIQNVSLEPSKKTYFIIHGYNASSKSKWVVELRDKLLELVSSYRKFIHRFQLKVIDNLSLITYYFSIKYQINV